MLFCFSLSLHFCRRFSIFPSCNRALHNRADGFVFFHISYGCGGGIQPFYLTIFSRSFCLPYRRLTSFENVLQWEFFMQNWTTPIIPFHMPNEALHINLTIFWASSPKNMKAIPTITITNTVGTGERRIDEVQWIGHQNIWQWFGFSRSTAEKVVGLLRVNW